VSGVWGEQLKISIFGESHGPGLGVVLSGLPAGMELDQDLIRRELNRRAPGKSSLTTPRKEEDRFEVLSGVFNNRTTGTPLCLLIRNSDQQSNDYEQIRDIIRPGHADYTGRIKYNGFNDYRGGGHFSGRITAALVMAGALVRKILEQKGIIFGSHINGIGEIKEESFDAVNISSEMLQKLALSDFPVLNEEKGNRMREIILKAKADQDSVGGVIETAVIGLPAGLGSPFFDSVESKLAHLLFSIPAVKGVEFGEGFGLGEIRGSEANDAFCLLNGEVKTSTNHCGGIQGGITNGMPLIFRTAFKPTPSIARMQKTVNLTEKEETEISIKGRHDPCIVSRAVPVVEAAAALALLDLMIERDGTSWMV